MLLAMLAAAAVLGAPGAPPAVYSAPAWLKKPSSDDLQAAWPRKALSEGVSGRATLSCEVNTHGLLEHCKVTSETPAGAGFGAAALLLTPTFLMRAATGPNGPIRSSVSIPIRFEGVSGGIRDIETTGLIMVARPVWIAAPTFADVGGAYPKAAGGVSGQVTLRCRVNADGSLHACDDLTEEPHNKGFAAAARSLTGKFRLAPLPPGKHGELTYLNLPIRLTNPQSAEFKDRHIGQPTWTRNLDPAKVAKVYPAQAAAKGIRTGRGVSECTVGPDGSLVGCKPLAGEPDGLGFSESAVAVTSVMRMNPWTEEGGPVDGAIVRIPIRFNLAPEAAKAPEAKSP
jgi:TonB family protein